jgi:hypothetical protein
MKEMRNIASSLRESLAALKASANQAVGEFQTEVVNGQANINKVKAVTIELKSANKEVEQILGQGDSNFPPEQPDGHESFDDNGVRPTQGVTPNTALDHNGIKRQP